MEASPPVCPVHGLTDVMPSSGRCRVCIEESNDEARPYLETAHTVAELCRTVNRYLRENQKADTSIA